MSMMERVIEEVGVSDAALNKMVEKKHILGVAKDMTNWQGVAYRLGLSEAKVEEIEENVKNAGRRREVMLEAWKSQKYYDATYRKLAEVFAEMDKQALVEKVCSLAKELDSHKSASAKDQKTEDEGKQDKRKKTESAEYRTFQTHCEDIRTGVLSGDVAGKMFSSSLLTREEWKEATEKERPEPDKMRAILHALDKRIATDPKAFHTFLEKVLEQEDAFESLVGKLKATYASLSKEQ